MKNDIIIKTVVKLLLPFIQIFSLYVLAHGELGPGGGFQGGVIFGASIILVALIMGSDEARKRVPRPFNDIGNAAGVLIYAGIGFMCMFMGGMFLEYGALPIGHGDRAHANHLGMIGIEIGVFVTVAAVMMTVFFEAAEKNDD